MGGQIRGLGTMGTKVPQRGPGMDLRGGGRLGDEAPEAKPTTGCETNV